MCFMLLEPCRTTTHTEGSSWHEWVHGANSPTPDFKPPGRHSSPIRMLLDQVPTSFCRISFHQQFRATRHSRKPRRQHNIALGWLDRSALARWLKAPCISTPYLPCISPRFDLTDAALLTMPPPSQVLAIRDDGRLWSLDAWLLSEVSHNYLPFADAYLAHLLAGLLQLRQKEIDTGCREQPTSSLAFRRKNLSERLAILSSRSSRLGTLCRAALAWSNFDHSVGDT